MARTAERPPGRPIVFRRTCSVCERREREDRMTLQRGYWVCWRRGCKDDYDPREGDTS